MKLIFCCSLIFLFIPSIKAQKIDKKLQKKIDALIEDFNGDIGIYIKNIKNDKTVMVNADTVFPMASIVKVPILIGVMDKINRGELTYHQELQYKDSLLYAGVDMLGSFKQNEKIELSKLTMLMLTMSDNTASLWLQKSCRHSHSNQLYFRQLRISAHKSKFKNTGKRRGSY